MLEDKWSSYTSLFLVVDPNVAQNSPEDNSREQASKHDPTQFLERVCVFPFEVFKRVILVNEVVCLGIVWVLNWRDRRIVLFDA